MLPSINPAAVKKPEVSVVSPVYRAASLVPVLVNEIIQTLEPEFGADIEIILVDDGSPDGSWEAITEQCRSDGRVKAIKLSRNFGQHRAIAAGLERTSGQWIVVMDCDLQDNPAEIPRLLSKAREGWDVVQASREERQDPWLKRFFSAGFYQLLGYCTGSKFDHGVANFGVYSRAVVDELNRFTESFFFLPLYVRWIGFRSCTVPVKHQSRAQGRSSYNLPRLLRLGAGVIVAFSDKPLRLMVAAGFIIAAVAFCFGLVIIYRALTGDLMLGWPSVMVSIWFLGGTIISMLGIVGLYVGKTFDEAKKRPRFVVECTANFTK